MIRCQGSRVLSIHPSPSVSRGSGPDLNILTDAKTLGHRAGWDQPRSQPLAQNDCRLGLGVRYRQN